MSRKIKFRVWDVANECWSDLFHAITEDGELWHFPNTGLAERDDKTLYIVEQYTGLKDKNGKEIYEGDIMRYDAIDYQVLWADYYAGFETKRLNSPWNNAGLTLHHLASIGKVIGNIHENSELLESKE